VTVYDTDNASELVNGSYPSINSMDAPKANADGSADIYFGPERPKGADNWLRTVQGMVHSLAPLRAGATLL
jgi:hypothetical protein